MPEINIGNVNETPINQKRCGNVYLEDTLRPLWNITYHGGLLLDWCRSIKTVRAGRIARRLTVALTFALLASGMIFQLWQLILVVKNMDNVHSVVPGFIWFIGCPQVVATQSYYLYHRSKFLAFFQDWSRKEREFMAVYNCPRVCQTRRLHSAVYIIYLTMTALSLVTIGFEIVQDTEAKYLISSYRAVGETLSVPVVVSVHLLHILCIWIFLTMSDLVPAFVFYHTGCAVARLKRDLVVSAELFVQTNTGERKDKLLPPIPSIGNPYKEFAWQRDAMQAQQEFRAAIRQVWSRFEDVSDMVIRANRLFGKLIVLAHGAIIFLICTLLYSVLYGLSNWRNRPMSEILNHSLNLLGLIVRLISCVMFSSKPNQTANELRVTLNSLLSKHWERITQKDRELLLAFRDRLQHDELAACPENLYKITPSFLLNVSGLVIGYCIVLLQQK